MYRPWEVDDERKKLYYRTRCNPSSGNLKENYILMKIHLGECLGGEDPRSGGVRKKVGAIRGGGFSPRGERTPDFMVLFRPLAS